MPGLGNLKPVGRPSDYSRIDLAEVRRFSKAGLTNDQIAELCEIAPSTFYLYQKEYPEFSEALKEGKEASDYRVQRALFERATGYVCPEEKVFYDSGRGIFATHIVLKHYPPDPTSMIFWLKNRKPKEWRDRTRGNEEVSAQDVRLQLRLIAQVLQARDG